MNRTPYRDRKEDPNPHSLLSKKQVANLLSVSERTVERLIQTGQLRIVRVRRRVRIQPEQVKRFIAEHETLAR